MTQSDATQGPPSLRSLDEHPHAQRLSAKPPLEFAYVPLIISGSVHLIFLMAYWLPELTQMPLRQPILNQLAPLVSTALASDSQAVGGQPAARSGLIGGYLMFAGVAVAAMSRARFWALRLGLWPVTALAAICCLVSVLIMLANGGLAAQPLTLALMVVWVAAAVITSIRSVRVDLASWSPPALKRWQALLVFAVVSPAPIALGRALFAPKLRDAAALVSENPLSLRWPALLTPGTIVVYLSGLLFVAMMVLAYEWLSPAVQRPVRHLRIVAFATLLALILTALWSGSIAADRLDQIKIRSPQDDFSFSCGAWVAASPNQPARTLVVSGLDCATVSSYAGYVQQRVREQAVPGRLSPISVALTSDVTLAGVRPPIDGKTVGARYDDVVVMAMTDRLLNDATAVVAFDLDTAAQRWQFSCADNEVLALRFAGASEGDDTALGRVTKDGEQPAVVTECGDRLIKLDPHTGQLR